MSASDLHVGFGEVVAADPVSASGKVLVVDLPGEQTELRGQDHLKQSNVFAVHGAKSSFGDSQPRIVGQRGPGRRLRAPAGALALALLLPGCFGGGFDPMGLAAHDIDWPRRLGTTQTLTIRIDWMTWPEARDRCARFIKGTDAESCALWKTGETLSPAAEAFMGGADCRIFAVPNIGIAAHELLRCVGGTEYRVGVMAPVALAGSDDAPAAAETGSAER